MVYEVSYHLRRFCHEAGYSSRIADFVRQALGSVLGFYLDYVCMKIYVGSTLCSNREMNDLSYLKTVVDIHCLRKILQFSFRARYASQ